MYTVDLGKTGIDFEKVDESGTFYFPQDERLEGRQSAFDLTGSYATEKSGIRGGWSGRWHSGRRNHFIEMTKPQTARNTLLSIQVQESWEAVAEFYQRLAVNLTGYGIT